MLVAAGILLSRLAGLIREKVFAHYLGDSQAAGAFKAALRIPNFLQNLFGEGVLSASFIPVYSRLLAEKDEETAGRVAGAVASLLTLVVGVIVALSLIATPLLVRVIAPGFDGELRELTIRIVRILFPGIGLLVLSAWCLGILNSHRQFFISYLAPVFWNMAMIMTLIVFGARLAQDSLAIALAWGTVAGCVLQFGVQVPFVLRYARSVRFSLDTSLAPVRVVLRNLVPVMVSRGVVQLSAFIDEMIASLLGHAAVASLSYAQTIYLLPISLFGMSVAAAELPAMSGEVGSQEEIFAKLRERVNRGLRQIAFFVIPSVIAFIFIGDLLVAALYQSGRFGPEQTRYVWYILVGSTVGLFVATLGRIYSSTFYALRDTRTPLRFAIIRVILTGILGYTFAFPLRPLLLELMVRVGVPMPQIEGGTKALGAIGLTVASGLAGWAEFYLLKRALNRKIGPTALPLGFQLRLWGAATVSAVFSVLAFRIISSRALPSILLHHVAIAGIVATIFGLGYFVLTMGLGIAEARAVLGRFGRFRRS